MIGRIKTACGTTTLPLWILLLIAALFFYEASSVGQTAVAVWTNRYDGPWHRDDRAGGIVLDGAGNVIVAGYSTGSSTRKDYLVIKYSSAGMALWTNRYDGPAAGDDLPGGLAVDGAGNVFVTGNSIGTGPGGNYATIAYSPAGMALWTNRYSGPGNSTDFPCAVAVDRSGNVFVTGASVGTTGYPDYLTIAYSGAGIGLWTNRYDGSVNSEDSATAMAVDGSGNVFVTGSSYNGSAFDYVTIAYSGAGIGLWTNRYDGPGSGNDVAGPLALDRSGNVFITGYSFGAGTSYDYATVAYSGAGLPLWTNRYNGPANSCDIPSAIAVDRNGRVFVTGQSWNGGYGASHYLTIAYSTTGVALWTNGYTGPASGPDHAAAVAVDSSGNVFVTGDSWNGRSQDYATVAYSSSGAAMWTNRYKGTVNGFDGASSLVVGSDGAVYVTGWSYGSSTGEYAPDFATLKYVMPRLNVTRTPENALMLSWPVQFSDYVLQRNDELNMINWVPDMTGLMTNATSKFILVDPAACQRLYRLNKP